MGKVLQIRVMAYTYSPEDVERTWPKLALLVWEELPSGPPEKDRGVFELVQALQNGLAFEDWDEDVKKRLDPGIMNIVALRDKLEAALADWNATEANKLSDKLEDALTELEKEAPATD